MKYSKDFETLWALYPKRNGNNPKRKAFNAYNARLRRGTDYSLMLKGLARYVNYCNVTNTTGTSFVMHAATFFGPDENYEEEWAPPLSQIKETIEEKGRRLNIQPRIGESMQQYERRISQAR